MIDNINIKTEEKLPNDIIILLGTREFVALKISTGKIIKGDKHGFNNKNELIRHILNSYQEISSTKS
jgi:hypothetical protein